MLRDALKTAMGLAAGLWIAAPTLAQEGAAAAEAEHAPAESGGGLLLQPDHGTALWTLILFLGLIFVLGRFVWPKIVAGLDARENKIRGDIESAQAANEKAQAVLGEYEQKLAAAHAEARVLIDQARSDGEKLRARLTAETEAELGRLRDRATEQIEQAKQAAVADLYGKAAELAVAVAGKILQRQINEQDTERLLQQSLSEMASLKNN